MKEKRIKKVWEKIKGADIENVCRNKCVCVCIDFCKCVSHKHEITNNNIQDTCYVCLWWAACTTNDKYIRYLLKQAIEHLWKVIHTYTQILFHFTFVVDFFPPLNIYLWFFCLVFSVSSVFIWSKWINLN